MTSRPVVLIADDYALTHCISDSILLLLAAGRLSGTGAMVTQPHWPEAAQRLAQMRGKGQAGLHLDLTVGPPLTAMPFLAPQGRFPSMPVLAAMCLVSAQARAEVQAEVIAQIACFRAHYGAGPDFIDGHRHVHVLPGVRAAVFGALAACGSDERMWLRSVEEPLGRIWRRGVTRFKCLVIAVLSAGFAAQARQAGFVVNQGFAGVRAFDAGEDFGVLMRAFLSVSGPHPLIMVHPGLAGDGLIAAVDAVIHTRPLEHAYLASPTFADDLAAAGLRIGRLEAQLDGLPQ